MSRPALPARGFERVRRAPYARIQALTAFGVSFAPLLALGIDGAGYLPRAWRLGTAALLAFAAAALIARRQIALSRLERLLLVLWAAVASWTALSAVWSDRPAASLLEAERTLVYVAAATAVLLVVRRASVPYLLAGVVAAVTVVSAYGLGKYLIGGHPLNPIQGDLLFEPIGYANGFGIFTAVGIVLAIGLALIAPDRRASACWLSMLVVLVPALYLTSSRGAWVAAAAGLATILVLWARTSRVPFVLLPLIAALAVVGLALGSDETGAAARFVGENRPHYWRVAWDQYTENPVLGSGAGTFADYWLRNRPISSFARDAHNLYLETLAELGPVGLALLIAALGLPLAALRVRRDLVAATAAGGYVALVLHAAVDWDWELPAVTLAGLVCGAALLASARTDGTPEIGSRTRAALLTLALGLAVFALVRLEKGPPLPF